MKKITIGIKNTSNNPNPSYQHRSDACLDIQADLKEGEEIKIAPATFATIPTGLYLEIPECYEVTVRPRSGLAAKYGITVLNSPGTIDSGYRGEIKVVLVNHGPTVFTVSGGDRIAQLAISEVTHLEWGLFLDTQDTDRGTSGFGSTGV